MCLQRKRESAGTWVESLHGSSPMTTTTPPSGCAPARLPMASASVATWRPTLFITHIARRPCICEPLTIAAESASLLASTALMPYCLGISCDRLDAVEKAGDGRAGIAGPEMRAALGFEQPLDEQLVAEKNLRAFFLEKSWIDLQVPSLVAVSPRTAVSSFGVFSFKI